MQTHGGRARAIESGDVHVDVAFVAAPTADTYGNLNGVEGKSACGTLGYPMVDVKHADRVVAITDNLVPYPACRSTSPRTTSTSSSGASIGDPASDRVRNTRVTDKPEGLKIAATAAAVIDGVRAPPGRLFAPDRRRRSFARGRGLPQGRHVEEGIVGSFAAGGITGTIVDMFEAGLFRTLFNVQCFDLRAVESYRRDAAHQSMSASMYANPHNKGAVVNQLDVMVLGAAEVDLDFNVNVTLGVGRPDHRRLGRTQRHRGGREAGPGDHLARRQKPSQDRGQGCLRHDTRRDDRCVVTDEGVAVNPRRADLRDRLLSEGVVPGLDRGAEGKDQNDARAMLRRSMPGEQGGSSPWLNTGRHGDRRHRRYQRVT